MTSGINISSLRTLIIENAKVASHSLRKPQQIFMIAIGSVRPGTCCATVTHLDQGLGPIKVFLKGPNRDSAEDAMQALFDTSAEVVQAVLPQGSDELKVLFGGEAEGGGEDSIDRQESEDSAQQSLSDPIDPYSCGW